MICSTPLPLSLIHISNWPIPRRLVWDTLLRARALENQCYVCGVNLSLIHICSEAAYKYTIEGSPDGKSYKMLVDGRTNWQVGFLILNVEDPTAYRYLRLRIYGVVNVHKGNSAMWADGIYEFTALGIPE